MVDDSSGPTRGASFDPGQTPAHALPAGTVLDEFEIRAVIGEGGFSIVYEAFDRSLHRLVAIKEYAPLDVATRTAAFDVVPRSIRHREPFEDGIRRFIAEARMLGRFDHPALVKVYRVWEARGTAYLAMPYYQGPTLKQAVRARVAPVDQHWLSTLLGPLIDALAILHAAGCVHRDVAPDNILLVGQAQAPVLLDFGAARVIDAERTQALTAVLKEGYAPIEQYGEEPSLRQGPWTDVYALAATLHWAITGRTPPSAVSRSIADRYQPLAPRALPGFDRRFLDGIDRALALKPQHRPASMADFAQRLGLADAEATVAWSGTAKAPRAASPRQQRFNGPAMGVAVIGLVVAAALTAWKVASQADADKSAPPAAPPAAVPEIAAERPAPDSSTAASAPAPRIATPNGVDASVVAASRARLQRAVDSLARLGREEHQDVDPPLQQAASAAAAASRLAAEGDSARAAEVYRGAAVEVAAARDARVRTLLDGYRRLAGEATDARQFGIAQQALDRARHLSSAPAE